MNKNNASILSRRMDSVLATNKVLRNTYILLALTLLFSAVTAYLGIATGVRYVNPLLFIFGTYGLMFLTSYLRNSPWGLVSVFAFTGFMGYCLGPILNMYLLAIPNGGHVIGTALGGTGIIFLALSAYVLTTQKDFSFMGGFLMAGFITVFVVMLMGLLFHFTGMQLIMSAAIMLLSSGMILYQTSEIIHGGETNYILATISLYVQIYNIFISLLQLLGAFSGGDRD